MKTPLTYKLRLQLVQSISYINSEKKNNTPPLFNEQNKHYNATLSNEIIKLINSLNKLYEQLRSIVKREVFCKNVTQM